MTKTIRNVRNAAWPIQPAQLAEEKNEKDSKVRIWLEYELPKKTKYEKKQTKIIHTESMNKWMAEWILSNLIASGFYEGKRILRAKIINIHN